MTTSKNVKTVELSSTEKKEKIENLKNECIKCVKGIRENTKKLITHLSELYNECVSREFDEFVETLELDKSQKSKLVKVCKSELVKNRLNDLPPFIQTLYLIVCNEERCLEFLNKGLITNQTSRETIRELLEKKKPTHKPLVFNDYIKVFGIENEQKKTFEGICSEYQDFIRKLENKVVRIYDGKEKKKPVFSSIELTMENV